MPVSDVEFERDLKKFKRKQSYAILIFGIVVTIAGGAFLVFGLMLNYVMIYPVLILLAGLGIAIKGVLMFFGVGKL
jgi:hypothetical protein